MTPSNVIEQILACLPDAKQQSTIYVYTGEQKGTWDVLIKCESGPREWQGLSDDPTSTLQEYVATNPEQQLRLVTFMPIQRFP